MAEFLNTSGVTKALEDMIRETKGGRLILISPYLKFNARIRGLLEDQANTWKADIRVVYGKSELQVDETQWLIENHIRTSFRENLHAKCYMNPEKALITSMNLYEFSQVNNDEMGILVTRESDPELYESIEEEAELILRQAENVKLEVTRVPDADVSQRRRGTPATSTARRQSARNTQPASQPGFCLRCGSNIPFNTERPYCNSDYRNWSRFKNAAYEERYCHGCGSRHSSSMEKPLCLSCYRAATAR